MNILRYIATAGAAVVMHSSVALGQTSAETITTPPVPPELQAPAGNIAYLKGHAIGTQNYICLPSATGVSWKFVAPQATLFFAYKFLNTEIRQQIATHFLSANPDENGTPRPAWQGSLDTSSVWGKAIASSNDPSFVATGAIPWLLLEVAGRERGPMGGSVLASTTFIQRLSTSGGSTPATGCSGSLDVGKVALVPYTADYFFYKASGQK